MSLKNIIILSIAIITFLIASVFTYQRVTVDADSNIDQSLEYDQGANNIESMFVDLDAKIESLATIIGKMTNNQFRMDQQLQGLLNAESQQVVDDGSGTPEVKTVIDPEQRKIEFQNRRRAQRDGFDNRVDTAGDAPWGIEAETKISSLLTEIPKMNNVVSGLETQCSDTLCRMDLYIPKDANWLELEELELELPGILAGDFARSVVHVEKLPDGSEKKTYYMARKGYTMNGELEVADSED